MKMVVIECASTICKTTFAIEASSAELMENEEIRCPACETGYPQELAETDVTWEAKVE